MRDNNMTAVECLVDQLTSIGVLEIPQGSNAVTLIIEQAKEMEQTNTDNKVIHFAEWLTKKHTYTLITLYEHFEEEHYGDK